MENLPTFKTTRKTDDAPTEAQTMETSSPASDDEGAHLDNLRMPEFEDADPDPDGPVAVDDEGAPIDEGPPEQISKEAFWVVFQTAFNMPGMILPDLRPMAIQQGEAEGARAASDATYALLEIYFPSALLPQSETLAHLMVAAPFFIGKAMVVREIIRSNRARVVNPKPQQQDRETEAAPSGDDWHKPGQERAA